MHASAVNYIAGYEWTIIGIIAIWLLMILVVSEIARRVMPPLDVESYVLSGRGIGFVVALMTLMATQYSALVFLGFIGYEYIFGIPAYAAIMGMYVLVSGSFWMVFGSRIWKIGRVFNHVTPSDTFEHYFDSKALAYVVSFLLILALVPYVQVQIMGVGYLFDVATGGLIPFEVGCVILYAIIVAHVCLGGLRGLTWTDTAQGFLLLLCCIVGGIGLAYAAKGGIADVFQEVIKSFPERLTVPGNKKVWSWLFMCSWVIPIGLGWPMHPHMWIRMHAPRSVKFLRFWPAWIAFSFPLVIGAGCIVAMTGLAVMPGQEKVADKMFVLLAAKYYHPIILGIIAAGGLAAMISSLDSQLHGIGSAVSVDWTRKLAPHLSGQALVWWARGAIFVVAFGGLILAFVYPKLLLFLGAFSAGLGAQVMPIALCVLTNQKWVSKQGAMAGLICGTVVMFITGFGSLKNYAHIYCGSWGLMANVILLVVVSLLTPNGRPNAAKVQAYQEAGGF